MKEFGLTRCLKSDPAMIEKYKLYHRQAFPGLLAELRARGITEMKIYLLGTRMFMYMETVDGFDVERDLNRPSNDPEYLEWNELMGPLQEPAPEARPGQSWAPMEEIFGLNWPQHRPGAQTGEVTL